MNEESLAYQLFDTHSPMIHGVSPQSGNFHTSIPIASFLGNNGLGPELDINLFYSPNMRDLTFKNWALRFTHYLELPVSELLHNYDFDQALFDKANTLYLHTGEAWKNEGGHGDKASPNFTVTVPNGLDRSKPITVSYKDGLTEELEYHSSTLLVPGKGRQLGSYYILKKRISPSGHAITLNWEHLIDDKTFDITHIPRLKSVTDESGDLLNIDYSNSQIVFTVYPNTSKSYTHTFAIENNQLKKSYIDSNTHVKTYTYIDPINSLALLTAEERRLQELLYNAQTQEEYVEAKRKYEANEKHRNDIYTNGPTLKLNTIEHASGLVETLSYNAEGFIEKFTSTTSAGTVKHSETSYTYVKKTSNSTTTITDNITGNKITYYFDEYILPIKEVSTINGDITTVETSRTVENELLTIRTKTTVTSASKKIRSDEVIDVIDYMGNLIRRTANGITTEWTYQGLFTANKHIRTERFTDTSGIWGVLGFILDHSSVPALINKLFGKSGFSFGTRELYAGLQPSQITYNLPLSLTCPSPANPLRAFIESEMVYTEQNGKRVNLSWTFYGYSQLPVLPNSGLKGSDIKPSIKLIVHNPVTLPNKVVYDSQTRVADTSIMLKFPEQSGLMIVEETQYQTDVKSPHHGRIISSSQSILNEHGKVIPKSVVSTRLGYDLKDGFLITRTTTTVSNQPVTHSMTTHARTGEVVENIDKTGIKTLFEYDKKGRTTKNTSFAGDPTLQVSATTEYFDSYAGSVDFSAVRHTPSIGPRTQEIYNALGQLIRTEQLSSDDRTWLWMSAINYDPQGRKVKVQEYDYSPTGECIVDKSTLFRYAKSGVLSQTEWPDGTLETYTYDPALRRSVQTTTRGSGKHEVVTTLTDEPNGGQKSHTVINLNNARFTEHSSTYDLRGRLIAESSTDTIDRTYTYDQFNRVTHITSGDRVTINEYLSYSPINIAVDQKVEVRNQFARLWSWRTLDALGRVTGIYRGGTNTNYTYSGSSSWGKISSARSSPHNKNIGIITSYDSKSHIHKETSSGSVGSNQVADRTVSHTYSLRGLLLKTIDAFGNTTHYIYNTLGVLTGTKSSGAEQYFERDGNGRLASETLKDVLNKRSIKTLFSYDNQNREIQRAFEIDGATVLTLKPTYKDTIRLSGMTLLDANNTTLRNETFQYNSLGQLTTYACTGSNLPITRGGLKLEKQDFEYDIGGNSTTRYINQKHQEYNVFFSPDITPDGTMAKQSILATPTGTKTSEFLYDEYHFRYKVDDKVITYTPSGQMASSESGYRYVYDSKGRLSGCHGKDYTEQFHYQGDYQYARTGKLTINQIEHERNSVLLNTSSACILQQQTLKPSNGNAVNSYSFEMKDLKGSVIASYELTSKKMTIFAYTPFGYRPNDVLQRSWIGFNGEPMDRTSDYYHLGNGTRVYDSVNQYFLSPDPESPFGKGGANGRNYCSNDPVNFSDPSGHAQVWNINADVTHAPVIHNHIVQAVIMGGVGVLLAPMTGSSSLAWTIAATGLAVTSAAFGITAAALEESNPELSSALSYASLATGILSAGAGMRASVQGLRNFRTAVQANEHWVQMGGTMQSLKQIDGELFTFVDTYKNTQRLNVAVHGKDLNFIEKILDRSSSVLLNDAEHSASDIIALLLNKGVDPSAYENTRLLICYSGNGGSSSFAAQFQQLVQRPVKAFVGPVTVNYGSTKMAETFGIAARNFGPGWEESLANSFARNGNHAVAKTNPYSFFSQPNDYLSFQYSPVYFR